MTGSGKTLAFAVPVVEILLKAPRANKWEIGNSALTRSYFLLFILLPQGAIILSPTRELALQTYNVILELLHDTPISHLLLTGGVNPAEDLERYNTGGCNIIVATPGLSSKALVHQFQSSLHESLGRLEDMFKRLAPLHAAARELEMLVLDEADKMLDLGFENSLNAIMSYLPKQRRTVR